MRPAIVVFPAIARAGRIFLFLVVAAPMVSSVFGQEPQNSKNPLPGREATAAMVAAAQVAEMRCGLKGQIDAMIAKARAAGIPFDVNDKADFANVLFFATKMASTVDKNPQARKTWCAKYEKALLKAQ